MNDRALRLFALQAGRDFGAKVSTKLGLPLSEHKEREFEDGEHKARPLESVREHDVYVVQSLHGDATQSVNDRLCRLLFFIGALKDASARRVTAVVPYLCYARKDRKTKARDPVTTRYVAQLFEAVGVDHVVTMDVHNLAAFQNAFRCRTDHLEARPLFVNYFAAQAGGAAPVVVSPDAGGFKRAERFREALSEALDERLPMAFMEKHRSGGVVSGRTLVGTVAGRPAIILDDLISTGTTMARTAEACREAGASRVYAAATHGLFVGKADEVVANPALDRVVVTNTIPPFRLDPELVARKLVVLDAAPLVAQAIGCLHRGDSVEKLLAP